MTDSKAKNPGGIDLNPTRLDLQTTGKAADFNAPLNLDSLQTIQIDGFSPVILQIVPTNLPLLFEISASPQEAGVSG
jgi:hypothetical protein